MKRNQTLSMILMLTAASGMAFAEPEKKQSEDTDLLRGPKVVDSSTPTNKESDDSMMQDKEVDNRPITMRELSGAIRTLSSEKSGNRLGLTTEQENQIKVVTAKFREDMQAFQKENRDKIREMRSKINKEASDRREKMREQREAGGDDERAQNQRPQVEQSETAKKLREMIENSPASKAALASMKKVLSEEQLQLVEKTVKKTRQRGMGDRAARPARDGEDGVERETPRRQIDGERVRPQQRRNQDQKNKSDRPIDD